MKASTGGSLREADVLRSRKRPTVGKNYYFEVGIECNFISVELRHFSRDILVFTAAMQTADKLVVEHHACAFGA